MIGMVRAIEENEIDNQKACSISCSFLRLISKRKRKWHGKIVELAEDRW